MPMLQLAEAAVLLVVNGVVEPVANGASDIPESSAWFTDDIGIILTHSQINITSHFHWNEPVAGYPIVDADDIHLFARGFEYEIQ